MRRALALGLCLAVCCGAALLGCEPMEQVPEAEPRAAAEPAPDFTLETLEGGEITLSALRGKPVLVDFWATWCGPCEQTIPVLVEFQRKYGDRVRVLGVSVDWEREAVAPFAREHGMNYPVLFGDEGLALQFGAPGFPTLFVVDAEGRVVKAHVGVVSLPELEASVEGLLRAE